MSTRLYPKYVLGNPQLRIFLPDFWMILVKNRSEHMAKNKVTFKVHPRFVVGIHSGLSVNELLYS